MMTVKLSSHNRGTVSYCQIANPQSSVKASTNFRKGKQFTRMLRD